MVSTARILVLVSAIFLVAASGASAATPFNAGIGTGHDLAVGSDGTGHVVWLTDETGERVGYCRTPAGGAACDSESTLLSFPSGAAAEAGEDAQVFTPAPNKVVILASCYLCGAGGAADRTYRWISNNNGADFGAPVEIGSLQLNGQAGFYNNGDFGLGVQGTLFQAMDDGPSSTELDLGGSGLFVYSPQVVQVPGGTGKWVHTVNDLDTVKYAVFTDPSPAGTTVAELNTIGNWQSGKLLPAPEGENDETHLSTGPSGVFLTYRYFVPNDSRIGLRKFDPATNTFGAPLYIEGPDAIDNNDPQYPHSSQDASGRIHAVWRTLHDGGRLRYTRSDDGGATFTAVANLATHDTFIDPIVEAGPGGSGFAVWRGIGSSPIRVVPIDPQPEPAPPVVPDTSAPTVGGFGIGDSTLLPGQGTTFRFNSSEGGQAVLTFQKAVKGLKLKSKGRVRCLPSTRKRLRKLRKTLAPKVRRLHGKAKKRKLAKLVRKRGCRTYKRIGEIRQTVPAGTAQIVFNGRIAGRKLGPGSYRALLVVTDGAGNVSRVESLRFKVLKPRRR